MLHQPTFIYTHTEVQLVFLNGMVAIKENFMVFITMKNEFWVRKKKFHFGLFFTGVSHSDEILQLFPISKRFQINVLPSESDKKVRKAITELWVNFARTG